MVKFSVENITGAVASVNSQLSLRVSSAKTRLFDDMKKDISEYVPYRTGALYESESVQDDNIVYTSSYAEKVNNLPDTVPFNRSVHSKATSHWLEVASKENTKKWISQFRSYL